MLGPIVGLIGIGFLGGLIFWVLRSFQHLERELHHQTRFFQNELLTLSRQMRDQIAGSTTVVQNYARQMGELQNHLGQLQHSTQTMIQIGRDISSLQDILRAPKLRGLLGELFLEELLRQILPQDRYILQYAFRGGEKVDAVILLGQGMVPVDAKFPLENFKRLVAEDTEEQTRKVRRRQFYQDVKRHIDQIATKYILPAEGTFDFALMYLPAENIYYEVILKEEDSAASESLSQYALTRKVIPVSPNSFYAYLQAIVLGLRGLRIENSAKEILASLNQLANDFRKFYEDFGKVGSHLMDARSAYEKADKRLGRLEQQLESIESQEATPPLLPGTVSSE